jgi:ribose transport system ATP-binding protein
MLENDIILEMRDIKKQFPGVVALNKAKLTLRKGQVHVLLGENGAGKSTLIKTITGAYVPDEGEIFLEGKAVKLDNPIHARQLGISAVYQEFNLINDLDVAKNIFLGRELMTGGSFVMNSRAMYRKSAEYLDRIGAKIDPHTVIRNLGVAAQQMVEITKAISTDCKILILDEPTAVLTEQEIDRLFEAVKILKSRGVAIVFISHRLEEIGRIGDEVTVMRDGAYVDTLPIDDKKVDIDLLVKLMVGREIINRFPKEEVPRGEEILKVEELSREGVLKNISLTLHAGEILGIGGLVGAGRTEMVKAIFGIDKADSKKLTVFGKEASIRRPKDAIKLGIGLAPEDRKVEGLNLVMSVMNNIIIASVDKMSRLGIISRKRRFSVSETLVKKLRIVTPSVHQYVQNLSGGNQQKVVLAKWLAVGSRIVIFDEPTRGIDVGAKVEVYQLMNNLVREGAGIIMISSDLSELIAMSDRILVMHEGQIAGELSRQEATQEKILRLAAGGI